MTDAPIRVCVDDSLKVLGFDMETPLPDGHYPKFPATFFIRADLVPSWQPIETAPRDGASVLAFFNGHHKQQVVAYWDDAFSTWKNKGGNYLVQVTHWMPLPDPPDD